MTTAIETRGLTKQFEPGIGAVDIDMEVRAGTVYGFLGPNGAGKSTTIRMLVGMLRPDAGEARVLGLDPTTDAVELKRRIGVVSSDARIPRHHSGRSLLGLLSRLRDDDEVPARGATLAERFDLDLDRPGHELSLGNRQKIGLVAALAHDPELVIMDEPSNGLDPLLQRELDELLRELTERGVTVLLSSHSLPEVERIADDVGFIRQARLVEQAPLAVLAQRAVRRAVLHFDEPIPEGSFADVEHVIENVTSSDGLTVSVTWRGPVAPVLVRAGALAATTIEARGADLEATFLAMYEAPTPPPVHLDDQPAPTTTGAATTTTEVDQ